jgi:pilus assembly protein CpaC
MLNQTIVLTGSVRNPTDSVRASTIAKQFATVEYEVKGVNQNEGTSVKEFGKTDAQTVINMLAVEAEEQVMLKVTIAEVQRSVLKQMGINLGAAISSGNFATSLLTENALPLTGALGLGTLPLFGVSTAGNPADPSVACGVGALCAYNSGPGGSSFGNSGASGGWGSGGNQVNAAIRALERDGLIRTLAEPNLTAVSGEPAKFLAGGEYPVPVVDTSGALSVTYKEFGVGLAFTPIVLSEGRISLKIETEVSELTTQGAVTLSGISIPALKKRQAKSTVELPSGGTLAMAGLISDDVRQNIDGLPGAKDIPILGTLFRSRDFVKNETELVVIVTPYLVRPTARQNLATPADGLVPATDMKANFLGHLNRIYGRSEALPDGGLKGDYGFIVE